MSLLFSSLFASLQQSQPASKTPGEFHAFVAAGGYSDPTWWSADGWGWRAFRNALAPLFWRREGPTGLHAYPTLRTVFEEVPMPWSAPVVVNFHEAKAFTKWAAAHHPAYRHAVGSGAGLRILTEAEHHAMRDPLPAGCPASPPSAANLHLAHGSEGCVGSASAPTAGGWHDVFGNAWEWCEDHQAPLPGFRAHPVYEDFTLPCFDGQHQLIMGGSFASTGNEAAPFARFQFRPHFHQHASFRVVVPTAPLVTSCMGSEGPYASATSPYRALPPGAPAAAAASSPAASAPAASTSTSTSTSSPSPQPTKKQDQADYETNEWISRYLHLHFPPAAGSGAGDYPSWIPPAAVDFPRRCAEKLLAVSGGQRGAALDIGCGVGGAALALAAGRLERGRFAGGFESVTGVELSGAFVDAAEAVRLTGSLPYRLRAEGDAHDALTAARPDGPPGYEAKVRFLKGDAGAPSLEAWSQGTNRRFDAILLGNLVCRLAKPRETLAVIGGELLAPGGHLLVTSPFSWKAEFTPQDRWLGGTGVTGSASCAEALADVLGRGGCGLKLVEEEDMPLVIRHHRRFYEMIGAHATLWRKAK